MSRSCNSLYWLSKSRDVLMVELAMQALWIRLLLSDSYFGITLQTMLPHCFLTVTISISPWLSSEADSQALLYGQDGQPRLLPQRQVPQ